MPDRCVFCDRELLRSTAEVYLENAHCVYASTRDPRDPPDVLPGCGVIVPIEHVTSPFGFTPEQWTATHELLLAAKEAWDERMAPDGYTLIWNCGSPGGQEVPHAHLHVIPRFDDEPLSGAGGRSRSRCRRTAVRSRSRRATAGRARSGGPTRALSGPCRP